MSTQIQRHQVVVVGARCAGAATAMLLARAGHDVVLLDRSAFPSDTVSTHGIARGGVVQLSRWGLLDEVHESGAPPCGRCCSASARSRPYAGSRTAPAWTTWWDPAGTPSTPSCRTRPAARAPPCAPG